MCGIHTDEITQSAARPTETDEAARMTNIVSGRLTGWTVTAGDIRLNDACLADLKLNARSNLLDNTSELVPKSNRDAFASDGVWRLGAKVGTPEILM